ncbi:LAME_0C02630g1_1 [Lachancea meyersii CBS 8951]|uniref:Nucleolar complex-associated protein 3 n=1 Tax=Lachancea meyersii CBS 8951 TaxID=1266667 RepID=A0A1G4J008_9SACH|nr:LAME_0C02630g1_1 [Lachancea meyersii CBS 8951]
MASRKRSQKAVQDKAAKRRKEQDALLEGGLFTREDVENIEDSTPSSKSWDDEEQAYEMAPRSLGYTEDEVEGLPIKVKGKIERRVTTFRPTESDKKEKEQQAEPEPEPKKPQKESDTEEVSAPVDTIEGVMKLKEEIAELVENLMENAEENISCLTRLRKMAQSKNSNTCKFSMLALVSVFKSIIPSYKIRPLSDLEKREKVTKEVAKLRNFEATLVHNYKEYVNLLADLTKTPNSSSPLQVSLGNLAASALVQLLPTASHFNFSTEVFSALIRRICKPNPSADPVYTAIVTALETLLSEDDDGIISLDVVRIMSKTLKTRSFMVDESVLNILLSLELLQDYDPNTKVDEVSKPKLKKKDRVHISKKQRKVRKEMKKVEEEMRRAEETVFAEERERNQAEILKMTLALYLNILKNGISQLIGAVLEGLSKFGHMSNFDLLGDFLEVMRELIATSDLDTLSSAETRKVLLCIVTAFSLVSRHSAMKVTMDLSSFVDALYAIIPNLALDADIEYSHKSLRLADPLNIEFSKPSVNISTKAELLLRALDYVFFRSKSGSNIRAAAFTKRLHIAVSNTPEKTVVAVLKFMDKLMSKYPEIGGLYSTEDRIGNGAYQLEADTPARSNAQAATIWENSLLLKHYSPLVVKGTKAMLEKSRESLK